MTEKLKRLRRGVFNIFKEVAVIQKLHSRLPAWTDKQTGTDFHADAMYRRNAFVLLPYRIFRAILLKIHHFFSQWKIYVGLDEKNLPPCSIVLFPLRRSVICCGFAGIMTVKGNSVSGDADLIEKLIRLFKKTKAKNMEALLSGLISPSQYLGDGELLKGMEEILLHLKREVHFERFFSEPEKARQLSVLTEEMKTFLAEEEKRLEVRAAHFSTGDMETINSRLIIMKDIIWGLGEDILDNVERTAKLMAADERGGVSSESFKKYMKINLLMNCIDRLEVRGRDSAGIQASFTFRNGSSYEKVMNDLKDKGLYDDFLRRIRTGDSINGSIYLSHRMPSVKNPSEGAIDLSFIYKTSSIIGELGQNIRDLRNIISRDQIFYEFSKLETDFETSMAHTRWASVGSITEENCHPINNFTRTRNSSPGAATWPETTKYYPFYGEGCWIISALLNGDIDNYWNLRNDIESGGEDVIAPNVSTDTKVIPLRIEKYLLRGHDFKESFRLSVNDFEGSHAIVVVSNADPGKIYLALKGSGQSIYVGLTPDQYIFSSELYGLVEGTPFFLKMDGEKPASPEAPETAGQIFILNQDSQGGVSGIEALFYDGTPLSIDADSVHRAEITTRDINRGNYPHYFLKEISEATLSVRKTLRGKYRIAAKENGKKTVTFNLDRNVMPEKLKRDLTHGEIRNIAVIGHGTAAVAGMAVADGLERYLKGAGIRIEAKVASELSGFSLKDDLKDTLVIPITQSGTTTDTNRAVAMAAERGATVIAIVNRRQSDITGKAAGVFYTSDGRDIEMSVASTKAFYSQIVAGHVLALYLAQLLRTVPDDVIAEELANLEQAPHMMARVIEARENIRKSVELLAQKRKYWAVVGSGPNKAAADEIRIKLSELCYKTISSDVIENKKHIDLSAEPLIIVCAAGNPETVTGDIVKDVAIFKAHRAGVIVFADEGEERFDNIADAVIEVPGAPPPLPVILNTLAGHLWGYYAACAINKDAMFLREFRSKLNRTMSEHDKKNYSLYERIADRNFRRMVRNFSTEFNEQRNSGSFSFTGVNTISDIVLLLKYAAGKLPLEDFWRDFKGENGQASPIQLLDIAIGHSIDELSRPIDAIRHQAKTVTVGTSRKEAPLQGILFDLLRKLDFSAKNLVTKNVLTISRIQPAVTGIKGYTLYEINNLDTEGNLTDTTTITIRQRGGISLQLKSRTEGSNILMGTKRTIVSTGHIYIGRGKSDGTPIAIIPLLGENPGVRSLLLVHVEFNEFLSTREKKAVLGYQYNDIRNLINEYNLPWSDRYLDTIPTETLLGEPAEVIVNHIRKSVGNSGNESSSVKREGLS